MTLTYHANLVTPTKLVTLTNHASPTSQSHYSIQSHDSSKPITAHYWGNVTRDVTPHRPMRGKRGVTCPVDSVTFLIGCNWAARLVLCDTKDHVAQVQCTHSTLLSQLAFTTSQGIVYSESRGQS